jgi:ABC-type sugar transport system permease subunit
MKAPAAERLGPRIRRVGYDRSLFAYLLNAPAFIAIFLLAGYPIVYSAWISLHKYNLKRPRVFTFIGLQNYVDIVQSSEFWSALGVTVQFTVMSAASRCSAWSSRCC